jgi:ectoine hydroxylase-related dioxygenase (phytanoyl-CoA dioxygenase family)
MSTAAAPAATLPAATCERFERDGFCVQPGFLDRGAMARYRDAALAYADQRKKVEKGEVFRQLCQVWRQDEVLRELTFHPQITAAVSQLSRRPMRLYHDQILIKDPHNGQASEFHQDRPYWPLTEGFTCSIWLALSDCPVESGCMSFIPGSHRRTGNALQVITWPRALFEMSPELEWTERVVAPLKAGGITFHQGWAAHRAGPNETDRPRVAFSAIYVEDGVRLTGDKGGWPYPEAKGGDVLVDPGCPRIC